MNSPYRNLMAIGAVTLAPLVSTPAFAHEPVKIAQADWTGPVVVCGIIAKILTDEMGVSVRRTALPVGPVTHEAVIAGDIDLGCEDWPSYNQTKEIYISEFGGDGSEIYLGETGNEGNTGYFVPRYMVEGDNPVAPDLKSVTDLNNYVDLLKGLETGDRGRLIGCPVVNWACEDQARLDALGVNFQAVELGSETAHWAEMKARYQRGEPFVAYAWEPHWIHAELDLIELEMPAYDEAKWPATDWPNDIPFNYGSPHLLTDHPEVVELVRNVKITNAIQAPLIFETDINGMDPDDVIEEWMAANEDIWRSWLP